MRYYLIAGEASGDLHAANLIRSLHTLDDSAVFRGWGGNQMELAGTELVKHYRDLAYMGFFQVITHLHEIKRNLDLCESDLISFRPDVLILIDYPGFNLRMAKFASLHGIRVFYYISPQLWAWRSSRVNILKKYVDHTFVILPFEKDFYSRFHYSVDFVGHPLLDVLNGSLFTDERIQFIQRNRLTEKPLIALLPGSRKMEIQKILHQMLTVIPLFPDYQFVIAAAPAIPIEFYSKILKGLDIPVLFNETYALLKFSAAALVTSGTATLEAALIQTPQVVCYRGDTFSYLIARKMVHIKYISLVNLILDEPLVKELIQNDLTTRNLSHELDRILKDKSAREKILQGYESLQLKLGGSGASSRTARLIIQYLTEKLTN